MERKLKITIITVCFNMEKYIRATLESILSQDYPNLEYIVLDGGSTDDTLAILSEYKGRISEIISEKDEGQYHAIQKGMDMATGDIVAWLNADDIYMPWTFSLVNKLFSKYENINWIIGRQAFINSNGDCCGISGNTAGHPRNFIKNGLFRSHLGGYLQQENMFWRRSLWSRSGGLNLSLKLAADFDLWRRFAQQTDLVSVSVPLAAWRKRSGQRSTANHQLYEDEVEQVCRNGRKPSKLWDRLARQGLIQRCLCRLFLWRKVRVISYSRDHSDWLLRKMWRPVSRANFSGLLLEAQMKH